MSITALSIPISKINFTIFMKLDLLSFFKTCVSIQIKWAILKTTILFVVHALNLNDYNDDSLKTRATHN